MTANDLAARQDESDNSRKKLVEQSREFKKATAEVCNVSTHFLYNFLAFIDC